MKHGHVFGVMLLVPMICAALFLSLPIPAVWAQETFSYAVELSKFPRAEKGSLIIDSAGIAYRSESGKRSLQIAFRDVLEADVSDPREIRIKMYDALKRKLMGRRTYEFRLRDGQHGPELARFLVAHLDRPVVGFLGLGPRGESREIAVYHRHRFGGCHGTLRIDGAGVQFVGDKAADSRTWPYPEIANIGTMNEFHFRVSTISETYNFDLKEPLPAAVYGRSFRAVNSIESPEEAR